VRWKFSEKGWVITSCLVGLVKNNSLLFEKSIDSIQELGYIQIINSGKGRATKGKTMKIETNHQIVGKKNSELGAIEIGSFYPVLSDDNDTIVGVFSAEFGAPEGYQLDEKLQAFVEANND
jgi:hypothetical protein